MKVINLDFFDILPKNFTHLNCEFKKFNCGEIEFNLNEEVENQDICIFQKFNIGALNDDILKLWICCDVLKRNNAKNIKYIAPFLPYTRQDRTYNTKCSLGSKIVANIANECGINEITTYDLHALQIECFFNCKVHNISAVPMFLQHIEKNYTNDDLVINFADIGSANRFKQFFKDDKLNVSLIRKTRLENGDIKTFLLGDVKDKNVIILDDMIDSGKTIIEATNTLLNFGAKNVDVYATHGVFSGNGIQTLNNSSVRKIVISNSIRNDNLPSKFEVINLEI